LTQIKETGARSGSIGGVRSPEAPMLRLAALIFIMSGATLAGILIVAALVAGFDTAQPIIVAAGLGFLAAVPVSVLLARRLTG